jgi:hypothetical protein
VKSTTARRIGTVVASSVAVGESDVARIGETAAQQAAAAEERRRRMGLIRDCGVRRSQLSGIAFGTFEKEIAR